MNTNYTTHYNLMRFLKPKGSAGFTLIEMIISLSIFVMVGLLVINVYVIINASQRRTVAQQKLQSDTRYLFEAMAQEVRLGKIDYSFYSGTPAAIDLHPAAATDNCILALTDQVGRSVFFRRTGDACDGSGVQYCEEVNLGDCALIGGTGWANITPANVQVQALRFSITPSADPFSTVAERSCDDDSDCASGYDSYRCDVAGDTRCEYYTDGDNFQPKVRIVFSAVSTDEKIPVAGRTISMQTTVSSRILQGQVLNTNY
ncbi:MAG: prepilin-type N-terminal cleavage/methylation domain-containing protein [Patescibacteria group bacterium]|nr:prepilin-type N-terminal cleavage/methylation domain-containing protein [Patescibacteria group bacterium]MDD5715415.1 prepilin-type N-terminal cleavage/methylation domain-containing protein [Patescibacteria group bacterium]